MNYDGENWELRNVEQWLKALFCSIPDLILFKDGDGRWIFASDYTLSLFGLGDHPYIGKRLQSYRKLLPCLNIVRSFVSRPSGGACMEVTENDSDGSGVSAYSRPFDYS